ncbi:MAG: hypothetical protein WD059_07935 [Balneolaceae bacterium]
MSKKRLIRRLSWYYPTELFNVFLFSGIAVWLILEYSFSDIVFLIYGLLLMVIILFQGQYYWKLKLDAMKGKFVNQEKALLFFRFSEKLNMTMIAIIPLMLLVQFYLNGWTLLEENFIFWAIFANIFGILEHINYYHRQLMVDNRFDIKYLLINKRLKISSLKKDLKASKI